MGIPDRLSTLIRASIGDLTDRAEDPETVIKQLLAGMHSQLVQVKTQVAAAIADQRQLYQRYQQNDEQATEWQRKAELAVEKHQDDLAREALQRRNAFQRVAAGYKQQYDHQSQQIEVLKEGLGQLEDKVREAETKKDLLIARSRGAKAETGIRTTLSVLDNGGAQASFERMEEKVDLQEARAAALGELETGSLDERLKALESGNDLDAQLEELIANKGLAEPNGAKALRNGQPATP